MKVVLGLGASCTGKSTLCKELVTNHHWKVADTDEFYYQAYPKAKKAVMTIIDSLSKESQECLSRYKLTDQIVDFPITGEIYFEDSGIKIDVESVHKESTEELLKKAGIQDADIPLLADCLREVAKQSESIKEVMPSRGLEQFFNCYLEHVFEQKFEPDDTIILDVNPHLGFGPAQILAATEKYIESYSSVHQDQSIEFFKVLVYCPPQVLSERLQQREKSGYTGNTARGLYSFEQLSLLVNAVPIDYKGPGVIDTLSAADIGKIVDKHVPEASGDMRVFMKARLDLADKFGIHNDEEVQLVATKDFPCDAIVDTSKADAETLANTLVDDIAASRQATMNNQ